MKFDISKFSLKEATSNENGKTSSPKTGGFYLLGIGGISFLVAMVGWVVGKAQAVEVMAYCFAILSLGTTLLGVKQIYKSKDIVEKPVEEVKKDDIG